MPAFELEHREEHGGFNAVIGSTDTWDFGHIRIEPPVYVAPELLDSVKDYNFELELELMDDSCTVITFYDRLEDNRSKSALTVEENSEMIKEVSYELLETLGKLTSREMFIKKWSKR